MSLEPSLNFSENPDFSDLLMFYMRRIRATAAGVASEIGMSREAVNNWRNGTSMPNAKSRDRLLACASYLRLTEAETNKLCKAAGFDDEFPLQAPTSQSNKPFNSFITQLFQEYDRLLPYPIMMLLSQAHWGQPPLRSEILSHARSLYGADKVLHIQPPYSITADSEDYFTAVGRQCGFADISSDYEFESALEKQLVNSQRIFCLVSRFEQGTSALRETLAGILRSLSEMYSGKLHLLICGGEALADLKYRQGNLSLLNIAKVNYWPELTVSDLQLINHQFWPDSTLNPATLESLLKLCGGHPALVQEGLQWLNNHSDVFASQKQELQTQLAHSVRLWQAFMPYTQNETKRQQLTHWLNAPNLGVARPYLLNDDLRSLFWSNLITSKIQGDEIYLHWRCEIIRQAGILCAA